MAGLLLCQAQSRQDDKKVMSQYQLQENGGREEGAGGGNEKNKLKNYCGLQSRRGFFLAGVRTELNERATRELPLIFVA